MSGEEPLSDDEDISSTNQKTNYIKKLVGTAGSTIATAGTTLTSAGTNVVGTLATAGTNVVGTLANAGTNVVQGVLNKEGARNMDTVVVVGEGMFRKQGSNVRSWKIRKYVVTSDHKLWYYDSNGVPKGKMDVKNIRVGDGLPESIPNSGIPTAQHHGAMAINIKSLSDNRILEIVFDSEAHCKTFLVYLNKASVHNNIPVRFLFLFRIEMD